MTGSVSPLFNVGVAVHGFIIALVLHADGIAGRGHEADRVIAGHQAVEAVLPVLVGQGHVDQGFFGVIQLHADVREPIFPDLPQTVLVQVVPYLAGQAGRAGRLAQSTRPGHPTPGQEDDRTEQGDHDQEFARIASCSFLHNVCFSPPW